MQTPTNLESRLEVSFGLRLDDPNQGKKNTILNTLHTKSESEQAEDMINFWKKQMEQVNITSHKEKSISWGGFKLRANNSCKVKDNEVKSQKEIIEDLVLCPLDSPKDLNPMQLTVRDCIEGENDARKWFVSTMHLYVKYLVNKEKLEYAVKENGNMSFLGSLYDVYLGINKKETPNPNESRNRLKLLENQCYDIEADDVLDDYGLLLFDKCKRYFF